VHVGEVFGLLGPNDAGKTTTIRILNTLLPVQEGSVAVFGHDVRRSPMAVRRLVGYGASAAVDRGGAHRQGERRLVRTAVRRTASRAGRASRGGPRGDGAERCRRPDRGRTRVGRFGGSSWPFANASNTPSTITFDPVTTTKLKPEMTSASPRDPVTGNLAISELRIPGVT
jgi:ABC transporter